MRLTHNEANELLIDHDWTTTDGESYVHDFLVYPSVVDIRDALDIHSDIVKYFKHEKEDEYLVKH